MQGTSLGPRRSARGGRRLAVAALAACLCAGASPADGQEVRPAGGVPSHQVRFAPLEPPPSSRAIFDVLVDRAGFLWMATLEGLTRYDGYEIQTFSRAGNGSLPVDDALRVLAEDALGMLWVGSFATGLSRYDPVLGTFYHYRHDPDDPTSLPDDKIRALLPAEDGSVWVGTEEGGLARLDPTTHRFTRFATHPDDAQSLPSNAVYALARDGRGRVWVGTAGGGLARWDPDLAGFEVTRLSAGRAALAGADVVTALAGGPEGELWVGTGGGLYRLDPETGRSTAYRHEPGSTTGLSGNSVTALHVDDAGGVWVGTASSGLNRLDPATGRVDWYAYGAPGDLPTDLILSLAADREGTLWVGTSGAGVIHGKRLQAQFQTVLGPAVSGPRHTDSEVRAIDVTPAGVVWLGLFGGGLARWDPSTGVLRQYPPDPRGRTGPENGTINSVVRHPDGTLWFGSLAGLGRLDPATGRFESVDHMAGARGSRGPTVTDLWVAPDGDLWVGSRSGLSRLDRSGDAQWFQVPPSTGSAVSVFQVYAPEADGAWVGTGSDGLLWVDELSGRVRQYPYPADSVSSVWKSVQAVIRDRSGSLWIGSPDGLFRLEPDGRVVRVGEEAGLRGVWVRAITEDRDGTLWMSTTDGLFGYDPETDRAVRFDESDGLPSRALLGVQAWLPDGDLLVGSYGGLVRFTPSSLTENRVPPTVHVTSVTVGDRDLADGVLSFEPGPSGPVPRVLMGPDDRRVSFEFAAQSFLSPTHNRYRYRLEGFEEPWHRAGADQRVATYTNLPPGDYTFHVEATNNRGVWSRQAATVAVEVRPPWWGTLPARILGAVGLMLLLMAAHRARIRAIQDRGRKLEREMDERRRSQDALDQLSHLERVATLGELTASIAHELNQPLSAVVANAEAGRRFLAREAMTVEDVDEILQDIASEGQRAGQVLQRLRALLRRSPYVRVPVDMNQVVTEVTDLLAADATRRRSTIETELTRPLPTILGDPVQMQQVVLNLLMNGLDAVDARREGGGRVGVRTAAHNRSVDVEVWDTGIGLQGLEEHVFKPFFTTKPDGLGMGVSLSRSIVEAHGGEMDAGDNPGLGATFRFSLPIGAEDEG